MSRGKYSPVCPHAKSESFRFNAKGEVPPEFETGSYNEEIHFGNYDSEGFDSYGYSAYDANKRFVGSGQGVDRLGNTEMDYLTMTDYEFEAYC